MEDPDDGSALPEDRAERIRRLVAECVERLPAEGDRAAAAVCAAHPDDEGEVRARLDKLRHAGLLDAAPTDDHSIPERLGDYRLIRRLGIGGMGVVYLAEQESLRRQVALKLVRPELLFFSGARERFRREVEAIARLADPGIVPIHAVGEHAGIPYFAMAYVEGATLSSVLAAVSGRDPAALAGSDFAAVAARLAGVPTAVPVPEGFGGSWCSACAGVVRQMAHALHHAHERGVVHRDVKPSNAILTPAGRVLLLDFGLAATAGATRLTRSGAQVGTLHAMAPEQLLDRPVDARTDVYALGVTLHELLALRPPYDEPTAERLRSAILAGRVPSPARENRAVSRDLVTICARAMDRDPHRRYATAAAFARDLEHFLAHRPIEARSSGPVLRSRRWAKRHPVTATAGVAVLLLGGLAVANLSARARSRALEREVDSTVGSALGAIDRLAAAAGDAALARTPGLDQVRSAQLDEAVGALAALRRAHPERRAVRVAFARALVRAADLHLTFGQIDAAERALERAAADLAAAPALAAGRELEELRATIAVHRGHAAQRRGDLAAAVELWRDAETLLGELAADAAAPAGVLHDLAACLTDLALCDRLDRRLETAEQRLARAVELDRRAVARSDDPQLAIELLRSRTSLALVIAERGRIDEGAREFASIEADALALVADEPRDPERRRELARARLNVARLAAHAGDAATARARFDEALAELDALSRDFPDRVTYAWERDMTALHAARTADAAGRNADAERLYRTAIDHHEALVLRRPDLPEHQNELAEMRRGLASLLERSDRLDEARALVDAAIASQTTLVDAAPADAIWRRQLGLLLRQRAAVLWRSGDPSGARADYEAAADAFARVVAGSGREPTDGGLLANALRRAAEAAAAAHEFEASVGALMRLDSVAPLSASELEALGARLGIGDRPDFAALLAVVRGR